MNTSYTPIVATTPQTARRLRAGLNAGLTVRSPLWHAAGAAWLPSGSNRVNILFLTWNFPPTTGGIEAVAWHMYRGLAGRGHALRVITRGPPRPDDAPEVTRVGGGRLPGFLARALPAAVRACRRSRPDIVLCGSVVGAVPAWPIRLLFGVPYAVLVYGSDVARGGCFYTTAVRLLLRRAARVCPISAHTRDLAARFGVAPGRLRIIPPGVEPLPPPAPPRSPAVATWIASGRPMLLSVGRLIRRKGVLEFVERVMPVIVREHPDALLVVVGEDAAASLAHHREQLRGQIEESVRRLRLSANVALAGLVEDVDLYALLRAARLLVMPVRPTAGDVEGFGIVLLEAALAGIPVVATRIGGIPDAVQDGVTGLLTSPDDDAAVAKAVSALLNDEALARRLGEAGRERALRGFTWEHIMGQYEDALASCLRRSPGEPAPPGP